MFDYTCCTVPSSHPKQLPCAQRQWPRINSLAGDFGLLHGWPCPADDFLFLSLRLWFQKLKTTRPRKINLSQFASENLNPIKSTLVVSGEGYSSVSQGQAFRLSLALCSARAGVSFFCDPKPSLPASSPLCSHNTLYLKTLHTFLVCSCHSLWWKAFPCCASPSYQKCNQFKSLTQTSWISKLKVCLAWSLPWLQEYMIPCSILNCHHQQLVNS